MVTATTPTDMSRRARRLAWATIAWNLVEAIVAIAAGTAAGSIALVGFGLDSTVEVLSAFVIVWQFHGLAEDRERTALRLIAVGFYALATYVGVRALVDLTGRSEPESSAVGIGLAIASLIVMPILAAAKRRTGHKMGSSTVLADSNQTKLCAYLSAILLAGLILNATLEWWWADPIAALAIAVLAANEGREAWRGDTCDVRRVDARGAVMNTKKENTAIVGFGAAACVVCCAGPIIAMLAAIGLGTAGGFALFGAFAILVGAAAVAFVLVRRRQRANACRADRETTSRAGGAHRRAGTLMKVRSRNCNRCAQPPTRCYVATDRRPCTQARTDTAPSTTIAPSHCRPRSLSSSSTAAVVTPNTGTRLMNNPATAGGHVRRPHR